MDLHVEEDPVSVYATTPNVKATVRHNVKVTMAWASDLGIPNKIPNCSK